MSSHVIYFLVLLTILSCTASFNRRHTYPLTYKIQLDPDIENGNFSATLTMELRASKPTDHILLRVDDINEIGVRLIAAEKDATEIATKITYEKNRFLAISIVDGVLGVDSAYILQIDYKAEFHRNQRGFYVSSYVGGDGENYKYAATGFNGEKNLHLAFPMHHAARDLEMIPIELLIRKNEEYTAIATSWGKNDENSMADYLYFDPPFLSVVHFSVIIGKFQTKQTQLGNVLYRVYYRHGFLLTDSPLIIEAGTVILRNLEEYLGLKYSMNKIDSVVLPGLGSNTEDSISLVVYNENEDILLSSINISNPSDGSPILHSSPMIPMAKLHTALLTIGRKMGFQFFGGILQDVRDVRVIEAARTFLSYKAVEKAFPQFSSMDFMYLDCVQQYLWEDIDDDSFRIVDQPGKRSDIQVKKVVALFRMFHDMPDDVFNQSLRKLLHSKMISNGANFHVLAAFIAKSMIKRHGLHDDSGLKNLHQSWNQTTGYPYVDISLDKTLNQIIVKQMHYYDGTESNWTFPISFKFEYDGHRYTSPGYLSSPTTVIFNLDDSDWLLANPGQSVPYRVNYEPELWSKLIERLQMPDFGGIHHINRAQLLDDSMALAHAGYIHHDIPFKLAEYLKKENHFVPWTVASRNFIYMHRRMEGVPIQLFLNKFIAKLVEPLYEEIGITDGRELEPLSVKTLRNIAIELACLTKNKKCIDEVNDLVNKVNENPYRELEPNTRDAVCCAAMRNPERNSLIRFMDLTGDDKDEREFMIRCHTCANVKVVAFLLEDSLEEVPKYLREEEIPVLQKYFFENADAECIEYLIKLVDKSSFNSQVQVRGYHKRRPTYFDWLYEIAKHMIVDMEEKVFKIFEDLQRIDFISSNRREILEYYADDSLLFSKSYFDTLAEILERYSMQRTS